jgi:hypothetical protein
MRRTIRQAYDLTLEQGGATLDTEDLDDYAGPFGWVVGGANGLPGHAIPLDDPQLAFDLFVNAYLDLLNQEVRVIGTWVDEGRLYVDAVDIITSADDAIEAAIQRGEKAIYNLTTQRTVEVS